MKEKIKSFGITALVALIGFSMAACDGGSGGGDNALTGIPALAGKWYRKIDVTILAFEITSASKFIFLDTTYDLSVSGNTAVLKFGSTSVGTFDYAISNDEMVIINGSGIGINIALLSPVLKNPTFTVTFNADGGTPAPPPQTVAGGGKATQPQVEKTGYEVVGWYKDEKFATGTRWNFATDTVTANITLYALWMPLAGEAELQ